MVAEQFPRRTAPANRTISRGVGLNFRCEPQSTADAGGCCSGGRWNARAKWVAIALCGGSVPAQPERPHTPTEIKIRVERGGHARAAGFFGGDASLVAYPVRPRKEKETITAVKVWLLDHAVLGMLSDHACLVLMYSNVGSGEKGYKLSRLPLCSFLCHGSLCSPLLLLTLCSLCILYILYI